MVQTTNRFFDEVARLMNDAAGVAQGVRREAETLFRTQAERVLREFAVIQREEFEAVKDMARLARVARQLGEQLALDARHRRLVEARLAQCQAQQVERRREIGGDPRLWELEARVLDRRTNPIPRPCGAWSSAPERSVTS